MISIANKTEYNPNVADRSGMPAKDAQIAYPYLYSVYGITLRSEIPLPLPEHPDNALAEVELHTASADWFREAVRGIETQQSASSWYQYARLADGSSYARWDGVGEFLVPADGKVIVCRQLDMASSESFGVYLLGQALSFAVVKQGFEPLHATAVVVRGEAVVFLGDSGFGKSSLAGCFLAAGHRILTDDLLILQETSSGFLAYPGPARIKLFPRMARKFLAETTRGVPMNPFSRKMILLLSPRDVCATPVPLSAIYAIAAPREVSRKQVICIKWPSRREAFLELVKNTFNYQIVDVDRLERQFMATGRLADDALVRKLSYPRVLGCLPTVCEAILRDIDRNPEKEMAAS